MPAPSRLTYEFDTGSSTIRVVAREPSPDGVVSWTVHVPGLEMWHGYTDVDPGTRVTGAMSHLLARLADDVARPEKAFADLYLSDRDMAVTLGEQGWGDAIYHAWLQYAREVLTP